MFSKACENGIRSVLLIASKSLQNERVGLKKIALEIGAPEPFTAKILQNLVRQQVLHSAKGPHGGFYMEREEINQIKLIEIVKAIDGDKLFSGCSLGIARCDAEHPCPLHDQFVELQDKLKKMLKNTSVFDLTTGINNGLTFLKR